MRTLFVAAIVCGVAALVTGPSLASSAALEASLEAARGRDRPVGAAERVAEVEPLRALFERALRGEESAELARELARFGMILTTLEDGLRLLTERPGERSGRGGYAYRVDTDDRRLVSAPHGLPSDDRLTAELVTALFAGAPVRAAAWSTVPRRELDLTHVEESAFQAFHLAFGAVHPDGEVVQIHGFASSKRKTERGRAARVILSNGTREPSDGVRRRSACLDSILGGVEVFPEVEELGATRNVQAQALRRTSRTEFLHVELSFPVRLRLVDEPPTFAAFARCLLEDHR